MNTAISPEIKTQIVEAWAKGWAITRGVSPPVREHNGFRIDLFLPKQLRRYIYTEPNAGFKALCLEITDPWIFLKVCAAPEFVKEWLPARWVIESPRFMMRCFQPMHGTLPLLPDSYTLDVEKDARVSIVRIIQKEIVAAIGRVVVVDDYIIYDRIETFPEHRRQGLATIIMMKLEAIGQAQGGSKGLLVATTEGKKLYEKLGWESFSDYTTVVIPGSESH